MIPLRKTNFFIGRVKELQTLEKAFHEFQYLLIDGKRGIGKTELTLHLLDKISHVPLSPSCYFPLNSIKNLTSLLRNLNYLWNTQYLNIEEAFLHLNNLGDVLFFQNLDLYDDSEFYTFLQLINRYITHPKILWTSTKSFSHLNLEGYFYLTLNPLELADISPHLPKDFNFIDLNQLLNLTQGLPSKIKKVLLNIPYFKSHLSDWNNLHFVQNASIQDMIETFKLLKIEMDESFWRKIVIELFKRGKHEECLLICENFQTNNFFKVFKNYPLYYLGHYEKTLQNTEILIENIEKPCEELALTHSIRGLAFRVQKKFEEALYHQKIFLKISRKLNNEDLMGQAYWNLSADFFRIGKYLQAKSLINRSIKSLEKSQNNYYLGFAYLNAFAIESQLQNFSLSQEYLKKTDELLKSNYYQSIHSAYLRNQSWLSAYCGDLNDAIQLGIQSIDILGSHEKNNDWIIASIHLAELYLTEHKFDLSKNIIDQIKAIITDSEHLLFHRVKNLEMNYYLTIGDLNLAEMVDQKTGFNEIIQPQEKITRGLLLAEIKLLKNEVNRAYQIINSIENYMKKTDIFPYYYNYPVVKSKYFSLFNTQMQSKWISQIEFYCENKIKNYKILLLSYEALIHLYFKSNNTQALYEYLHKAKLVAKRYHYNYFYNIFSLLELLIKKKQDSLEKEKTLNSISFSDLTGIYKLIYLYLKKTNLYQQEFKSLFQKLSIYEKNLIASLITLTTDVLNIYLVKTNHHYFQSEDIDQIEKHQRYDILLNLSSSTIKNRFKKKIQIKAGGTLFSLLKILMETYPHPINLEEIYNWIWGRGYDPQIHNTKIYTTINRLRTLIGDTESENSQWIINHAHGYMLSEKCKFYFIHPLKGQNLSFTASKILDYLQKKKKLTCAHLVNDLGIHRSKAKRELKTLVANHLIKLNGKNKGVYYTLP